MYLRETYADYKGKFSDLKKKHIFHSAVPGENILEL